MHAKTVNDILSAVGLAGSRYRSVDGGVAILPLPHLVDGAVLSKCCATSDCTVRYAEVNVKSAHMRLKLDNDPAEAEPRHELGDPPDCDLHGLEGEDGDEVRRVLAALSAASLDGVQPVFEMLMQPTQCVVYACSPATKYDHLLLADVLSSHTVEYDTEAGETRVVVQLRTPSSKRIKR